MTPKIIRIIDNLYNETECAVVIDGQLIEWFAVKIGLRKDDITGSYHLP